jgi:hypothetical protein
MTIINRTFDRRVRFDERSRAYPIRALVRATTPRSYTWGCAIYLDQGTEGACTGFAVTHEAAAKPVAVQGLSHSTAQRVYHRARQLDEYPGEDYDGSSVLGAIKAAQELGWVGEYRWAFGIQDLRLAIGYKGPAVLGINWYEGMFSPNADTNFISPTGALIGGHAILCNGYNASKDRFTLHNSWGKAWGRNGECFITGADLERLLHEQGEACIPVVRKVGAV